MEDLGMPLDLNLRVKIVSIFMTSGGSRAHGDRWSILSPSKNTFLVYFLNAREPLLSTSSGAFKKYTTEVLLMEKQSTNRTYQCRLQRFFITFRWVWGPCYDATNTTLYQTKYYYTQLIFCDTFMENIADTLHFPQFISNDPGPTQDPNSTLQDTCSMFHVHFVILIIMVDYYLVSVGVSSWKQIKVLKSSPLFFVAFCFICSAVCWCIYIC